MAGSFVHLLTVRSESIDEHRRIEVEQEAAGSSRRDDDAYSGDVNASKTFDRGLQLLETLARAPDGLTVSELAKGLGVHRAAIYRLINPLSQRRLVRRARDGRYFLGPGLVELAGAVAANLQSVALPELRVLADELEATAFLTVLDGADAVATAAIEPRHTTMHVAYRVGFRHPANQGASGIAILAGRSPETDEPAQVSQSRKQGYAITSGHLQQGAVGIAAPIRPGNQPAESSIGVVAIGTLDESLVAPRVMEAADTISRALG